MKIIQKENDIILKETSDFHVGQTLECGQCFHFKKLGDNEYGLSALGKLLHIKQTKDCVILYNTTEKEYRKIWEGYFDLKRDYGEIKRTLLAADDKLGDAIKTMWGVRILKQDFFETLISFIISQNKQIPHIKQIVADISRAYGTFLGEIKGESFYSFPDCHTLKAAGEEELRRLKTGFRAPYICDAAGKISDGMLTEELLRSLETREAMNHLMEIKGVGEKVASCVMLFGLGMREEFPVDVWIKRIMEELYFHKETSREEIRTKAMELYGSYGGYAQQYLFYYGRVNQIGKKVKNQRKSEIMI